MHTHSLLGTTSMNHVQPRLWHWANHCLGGRRRMSLLAYTQPLVRCRKPVVQLPQSHVSSTGESQSACCRLFCAAQTIHSLHALLLNLMMTEAGLLTTHVPSASPAEYSSAATAWHYLSRE